MSPELSPLPKTRRTFVSDWDELTYLHEKLLYWFYGRGRNARALHFATRAEMISSRLLLEHKDAVFLHECLALVYEVRRELRRAARHRETQIRLLEQYIKIARPTSTELAAMSNMDYEDLARTYILNAMIWDDLGEFEKARKALRSAKSLAEEHGFAFTQEQFLANIEHLCAKAKSRKRRRKKT